MLHHSPPFLGCPPIADLVVWCDAGGAACRQAGPGKHSYRTYLFCTGTASALLQEAKFLILEQAFLEALQAGQGPAALALLREQLAPLGVNPARLHRLAACLMGGGSPVAQVLAFPGSGSSSDSEEEEEEPLEPRRRRHDGAAVDMVAQRRSVLRKLQVGWAGPGMHARDCWHWVLGDSTTLHPAPRVNVGSCVAAAHSSDLLCCNSPACAGGGPSQPDAAGAAVGRASGAGGWLGEAACAASASLGRLPVL